jgi:mono/diheme cytochrome c family protein
VSKRFLIAAFVSAAGLATATATATALAQAQGPATVLDGVYTPAQAARGEAVYTRSCSGCHEGQDADGPLLAGKIFLDRWREDRVESLYAFIATSMPGNNPGGLDASAYADVVAFMLETNGLPPGTRELSAETVRNIQLVGPDGPRPLANLTIVRAVGCLTPAANDAWILTQAGTLRPVRARVIKGTTPEELSVSAAQPLGAQTFPLMSVTPQLAPLRGNKVQVKGVLTRQGTLDRINVMSLDSVAATCGG